MQTTDTQRFEGDHHSPEERAGMIARMREINECLYWTIFRCGLPHAFIEFCGLMHKYVDGCQRADSEGADFTCANTHMGRALPFEAHDGDYLGEKLNCIFGPALFENADFRRALIRALFEGHYELVEAPGDASGADATDKRDAGWLPAASSWTAITGVRVAMDDREGVRAAARDDLLRPGLDIGGGLAHEAPAEGEPAADRQDDRQAPLKVDRPLPKRVEEVVDRHRRPSTRARPALAALGVADHRVHAAGERSRAVNRAALVDQQRARDARVEVGDSVLGVRRIEAGSDPMPLELPEPSAEAFPDALPLRLGKAAHRHQEDDGLAELDADGLAAARTAAAPAGALHPRAVFGLADARAHALVEFTMQLRVRLGPIDDHG